MSILPCNPNFKCHEVVGSKTQHVATNNSKLGILSEKYESCGDPCRITYESEVSLIHIGGTKLCNFVLLQPLIFHVNMSGVLNL